MSLMHFFVLFAIFAVSGVGENSSDRMSASPNDNKHDDIDDTSASEKPGRNSLDGAPKAAPAFPR